MEVPEKWEMTRYAVEKSSWRFVLSLGVKMLNSVEYITDRGGVFGNFATYQMLDKHIPLSETGLDDLKCV